MLSHEHLGEKENEKDFYSSLQFSDEDYDDDDRMVVVRIREERVAGRECGKEANEKGVQFRSKRERDRNLFLCVCLDTSVEKKLNDGY